MQYKIDKQRVAFNLDKYQNLNSQVFLDDFIPSKKLQHQLLTNKEILLDGQYLKRNQLLKGKYLSLPLYKDNTCFKKEVEKIPIIYSDPFCYVVHKRSGLLVHSDGQDKENLTTLLSANLGEKIFALHRCDKETCGLVVFSRSSIFQPLFDKLFFNKQIERIYLALVNGNVPKGKTFVVDKAIGRNRHDSRKRIISVTGKQAKTIFTSLGSDSKTTLLECQLKTGRTHQIRVHLLAVDLPIIGDKLYGKANDKGLALYAYKLSFYHPILEKKIIIKDCLDKRYGSDIRGLLNERN